MRNFKKYFFESIIQLTILANVFRQNSRYTDLIRNNNNNQNNNSLINAYNPIDFLSNDQTPGQLDFLLMNHNINNYNNLYSDLSLNNSNFRNKNQTETYLNELKTLERLNDRLLNRQNSNQQHLNFNNLNQFLFVAPASFVSTNNNQKELINLSEARLLLSEFNNQLTKEDIEMDINLQAIIQQDIDLGITKTLNYDLELAAQSSSPSGSCGTSPMMTSNDASLDFDFLNYYNHDPTKSDDMLAFKQIEENQKNTDIMTTTGLFENQGVPDGYKLVLEEDTGEWFLIMISNESNKTEFSRIQIKDGNVTNLFYNSTNESTQNVLEKPLENGSPDLNIKVQFSVFFKEDTINLIRENYLKETDSEKTNEQEQKQDDQRPVFLSQVSVNQTLEKLNENLNIINQNTTIPNLDDSILLDENLLNESWLNNILDTNESADQMQTVEQQVYYNQKITNDKMLYSLNQNQSVIKSNENQTFLFEPPKDQFYSNNNTLFNNTDEILSKEIDSQFESLLDQAILNHEQTIQLDNSKNINNRGSETQNDNGLNINQLFNYIENNTIAIGQNSVSNGLNTVNNSFSKILTLSSISNDTESDLNTLSNASNNNNNTINTSINSSIIKLAKNASNNDLANLNRKSSLNSICDLDMKKEVIDLEISDYSDIKNNGSLSNQFMPRISAINDQSNPALTGLLHNHTYLAASNSEEESSVYHPYSYKNKLKKMLKNSKKPENETRQESRDEQLLRENNIQITLSQVVDTNADEFNELIKEKMLNQDQINVVKDIRRRGKNKVAAQICRKRKLDSIDTLKEDVEHLKERRSTLFSEYTSIHNEIREMTMKFDKLYKDATGNTQDPNDPILVFINNLKDQLNNKDDSNQKVYNSDSSFTRELDSSYSSYNQNEDDYDEEEDEDDDDDDTNSISGYSDDLSDKSNDKPASSKKASKLSVFKSGDQSTIQPKKKFKKE